MLHYSVQKPPVKGLKRATFPYGPCNHGTNIPFLEYLHIWRPRLFQRADNSIQWIDRYPADKMYSNQCSLSAG